MKTYYLHEAKGIDSLQLCEVPPPRLKASEVLVSMQAWSLNYRDLAMPGGGYPGNTKVKDSPPLVPLSDGAGEVIAIGDSVTRFKIGDRVASCFFADWVDGPPNGNGIASALGGARDGVLAEEVALNENALLAIPDHYSFEQAACLPCAGVTAFEALCLGATARGDTLLTLGTGGVSLFALQFATALGADVYITSSSEEKLERSRGLGASHTINYKTHPDWPELVLGQTGGEGVDHVIELGGAGTLERSLQAVKVGGHISLIGVLSGEPEHQPSPMPILFKRLSVQGIYVGSRTRFESLLSFVTTHGITPVIDTRFAFDQVREAYRYLKSGAHFGKVVITR